MRKWSCSAAAAAKSLQSCRTPYDLIDGSPPGSPVHGILQARILEWVAISFSNACMHAKSLQSCLTLCDPNGQRPTGPSDHGIPQARILCGFPLPAPGDLPDSGIEPRYPALQANSSPSELAGKPWSDRDIRTSSLFFL